MIVKFMKNQKGGSSKAIDYLLNFRREEGTAKIIKGDEKLTRLLIDNINRKQKVTVGVLNFEEQDLATEIKHEIMASFEKILMPQLNSDEYNILWVEHQDKDKLELNFVIPRIHLKTQKGIQPYFHGSDLNRVDNWKDIINEKYRLTNPKSISKQKSISISSRHPFSNQLIALDNKLHLMVKQGYINNREEVLSYLSKQNYITITRTNENFISIKLDGMRKSKRLTDGIYSEKFTSQEAVKKMQNLKEKSQELHNSNTSKEDLIKKVIYKIYKEEKEKEKIKELIKEFFMELEKEKFLERKMIYELSQSEYRMTQQGRNFISALSGIGMLELFNQAVIIYKSQSEIKVSQQNLKKLYLDNER